MVQSYRKLAARDNRIGNEVRRSQTSATTFPTHSFIGKQSLSRDLSDLIVSQILNSFKTKRLHPNFIIQDYSDSLFFVSGSDTWTTLGKLGSEQGIWVTEGQTISPYFPL
jgi:hypothetical protein